MTEREAKRLEKINEKMEQMKAQKHDILAQEKKRERKERTRHLIQIGALSEKYFDFKDVHPTEYEKFLKKLFESPRMKVYVEDVKDFVKGE